MKETELKLYPCYCGGEMEIKKVAQNGGMDGTYYNWELTCKKCGLAMTSAADGFYGRKYKTFEEVVGDWNRNREKEKIIKALEQDCISRQATIKALKTHFSDDGDGKIELGSYWRHEDVVRIINDMQPVMPQPKTGRWITRHYINKNGHGFDMGVCSECHTEYSYDAETGVKITDAKFCPECGIKMEVKQ